MKHLQKVFLLLNGESPLILPEMTKYDLVCATDGAYHFLEEKNIQLNIVTGDFDSIFIPPKNVEAIHTPDQNFTDFEKMLFILHERGYRNIDIFGASGKEQDHFLGNLHTALKWKDRLKIKFFDNHGLYFFSDKTTEIKSIKDKTVSLIPFPEAKNILSTGLQYSLKNDDLSFSQRIGLLK